jgi:hypothetical protein
MDDLRKKLGNQAGEEKLKKLAEKFVTYFSGTFQCNVGHQVMRYKSTLNSSSTFFKFQLEYDCQTWKFIVLKVECMLTKYIFSYLSLFSLVLKNKIYETTKLPKTKIIFLIDGIPHYVRG